MGRAVLRLTAREVCVCRLLLDACSNAEIAQRLGIAPRTVKAIFNRLFLKFGITDRRVVKRVVLAVKLYRATHGILKGR